MVLASLLAAAIAGAGVPAGTAILPDDPSTADVCALIPGKEVAAAVDGRLEEARLVRPDGGHARCAYAVSLKGAPDAVKTVFVLWLYAPSDFQELREYQDDPWQPVSGVGDDAFITFHADMGRHELYVLLQGLATIDITGEDPAAVRAVAAVAIERLRTSAGR